MGSSSSRRAWMLVTLLVLVFFATGHSKPFRKWSPGVFPNPQLDVHDCGRDGRKSSICDPENILSRESANMVDGLINEIAEGTPPFRSAQCGTLGQKGFQVRRGPSVWASQLGSLAWIRRIIRCSRHFGWPSSNISLVHATCSQLLLLKRVVMLLAARERKHCISVCNLQDPLLALPHQ
jgi:hypothetical protein